MSNDKVVYIKIDKVKMKCEDVYNDLKTLDVIVLADNYENRFIDSLYDISYVLTKIGINSCIIERTHNGIKIKNTLRNWYNYLCYKYLDNTNEDDCIEFLDGISASYYNEFKKIVDTRDDMYHFIFYECGNTKAYLYFNKNKLKLNFSNTDVCKALDFIPKMCLYDVNMCNINTTNTLINEDFANLLLEDINSVLYLLKTLNCDEETKMEYYKDLIKVMSKNRKFKERCEEITSFEEKIKIIEMYKNIRKDR